MSEGNVETLRRGLEAFTRGDRAVWLELTDPDVELVPVSDWPEVDQTRGAEAVWNFFVSVDEAWEGPPFGMVEAIELDDKVVGHVRRHMHGRSSGAEVEFDYWNVTTFRAGKVVRMHWLPDRDSALEAAGAREPS